MTFGPTGYTSFYPCISRRIIRSLWKRAVSYKIFNKNYQLVISTIPAVPLLKCRAKEVKVQPKRFIGLSDILKRCSLAKRNSRRPSFPVHAIDYSRFSKIARKLGARGGGKGRMHLSFNRDSSPFASARCIPAEITIGKLSVHRLLSEHKAAAFVLFPRCVCNVK